MQLLGPKFIQIGIDRYLSEFTNAQLAMRGILIVSAIYLANLFLGWFLSVALASAFKDVLRKGSEKDKSPLDQVVKEVISKRLDNDIAIVVVHMTRNDLAHGYEFCYHEFIDGVAGLSPAGMHTPGFSRKRACTLLASHVREKGSPAPPRTKTGPSAVPSSRKGRRRCPAPFGESPLPS